MKEQLLTTYSFFAALTENNTDIYSAVYIPMCKRALSLYAKNKTFGSDYDIRNLISLEYGVNVPLLIVRKLIKSVEKGLSRKDRAKFDFQINEKGNSFSFSFKSYAFSGVEDSYDAERRKSNALQQAFEIFAKNQGDDINNLPAFSDFIDKNKNKISSFLSGKVNSIDCQEVSFMTHVRFLQYIEQNDNVLYQTTQKIFIGSVIASYLESNFDLEAKIERGTSYYLDTQIVLELLDLQRPEDAIPTKELVNLIQETGGNVRLLDITLTEIKTNINNTITHYNRNNPTTTINEACIRLGKNKTWLINLNGKLENILQTDYKINIDKIPESDIELFANTEDAAQLKEMRYRKHSAIHDVIAYLYVREKRKYDSNKKLLQKASYWFITANRTLCDFNISKKVNGNTGEIIMPDELTSLLFLQNPKKLSGKVSLIGLNELIAQTLSEEYPSRDLINEFDSAVSALENVSADDYNILLSSISQESTIKIHKLLISSISEPEQFNKDIHAIIETERNSKLKADHKHKEEVNKNKELQDANKNLSKQLADISQQIVSIQETQRQGIIKSEEKERRNKRWHRIYISIIIILVSVVLLLLFPNWVDWLKYIIKGILGLSGLWGFLNFLLNASVKVRQLIHL